MIRPITCVCFLLACGSGLYLYQAKHRVHVIDVQIEKILHQTEAVREQTRILHAEWTLLDQPDRLQQLSSQLLKLQTTKPAQFASAADLNNRLPPVPAPPQPTDQSPGSPADSTPVGPAGAALVAPASPERDKETKTEPPAAITAIPPATHGPERTRSHPPEVAMAEPPRPHGAASRSAKAESSPAPREHSATSQPARQPARAMQAALSRTLPAERPTRPSSFGAGPRVLPGPVQPVASVSGGSLLGMAHAGPPALPAPTPVWTNWNNR